MKIEKKASIFLSVFVVLSVILTVFFHSGNTIKANEAAEKSSTNESTQAFSLSSELMQLPRSEKDLHDQEDITIDEMEAYMNGTNFQNPQARATGKITGAMTQAEYTSQFGALNQTQNDNWNAKYGFNPNYNVKSVSTWDEFKAAFEDNTVSKIVLTGDISYNSSTALQRKQSLELDGQGFKLHIYRSSLNFTTLASLSTFDQLFSAVPVFHMHDIQLQSSTNAGEGTGGNYRSFINGDNANVRPTVNRQLWRYRMGNVYTPRSGTGADSNLIQGRLIRANQAEISIWGYNNIVTGAENFYTGGIKFEPYSYYKGANANYNYSTIWFTNALGDGNYTDWTGDNRFVVGEGSFVYLNNIGTGDDYPGIYEFCSEVIVEKDATLNVNVPGIAVQFNLDNAKFVGEKGSTVNLLSRNSASTISFDPAHTTHGSESDPKDCTFQMNSGSRLFVVGSKSSGTATAQGVVSYGSGGTRVENNVMLLDNPESFDIRNTATSNNAFLGDSSRNRGKNMFIINNSDISLWNTAANIDGEPSHDYMNVKDFKVTNEIVEGRVTSSDPQLASQYTRTGFKRISGMNGTPELIWTPVTDADYNQRSTILLGYTAVGGSNPFDENGDAYVKPVYADGIRKAYVDYTDTIGNTYTGISSNDGYVHWTPTLDSARGNVFQIADQEMSGTPYRATESSGVLTPYRTGDATLMTVLDVTPPEPATLVGNKITNATKQLVSEGLEPNAKVFISIDGGAATAVGSVGSDGKWSYDLPSYLTTGQTVMIYLQDAATEIPVDIAALLLQPNLPTTHTNSGNINPYPSDVAYSDALFKKAILYTVIDVLPDNPKLAKAVSSSGGATTSVGDSLTYTLTGKNDKANSEDWSGVVLEDVLPAGLNFDEANHGITIKKTDATGTATEIALTDEMFDFNETTRLLKVKIGDVPALNGFIVTFKVTVTTDMIGQNITNIAEAKGYSPQEANDPFVPGPIDPDGPFKEINVSSNQVGLPGDEVHGILQITSAPTVIDFEKHVVKANNTRVEEPILSDPLTVSDNRGNQKSWTLTAKLTGVMTNIEDTTKILAEAIKFNNGTTEEALDSNEMIIKTHTHSGAGDYVVSDDWSAGGTGLKLEVPAGSVHKLGKYKAEITWILGDTPTP